MNTFRNAKDILCNYQLMSAFDVIKHLYLNFGMKTINSAIKEISNNAEKQEINYAGIIYKEDDRLQFIDENNQVQIGVIRFGLYSTFDYETEKFIQHLGWVVDYDVNVIGDTSWEVKQKTLIDFIRDFNAELIE